ncbi:DUF3592 domain-containing protein [Nocardiopsis suaedae]|uniref:DUF3592 domain-containing protein n=1 Tax=Nocardiopsis suaedae TaxID=3018444 RepID=A0ABT4TJV6_9ACTN|nr:DUF3592 domain-containing protein [Nocardiopsis suaedae]MDA2804985.1 hypothetical protein [Nocardiopsis suaedae]
MAGRRSPLTKNFGSTNVWLVAFGVALLIVGVRQVAVGTTDYTDHTGRAEAVVSERLVERADFDDRREQEITVFVAYTAEGEDFTRVELEGLNSDDPWEGDELTVAYAPGEPGHVVTVPSTEEGAHAMSLYGGIAALALSVLLSGAGAALGYRHFRRRSGRPDPLGG